MYLINWFWFIFNPQKCYKLLFKESLTNEENRVCWIKDSLRQMVVMDGCLKTAFLCPQGKERYFGRDINLLSNVAAFLGLFNRSSLIEDSQELENGVKILSRCPIYRYVVRMRNSYVIWNLVSFTFFKMKITKFFTYVSCPAHQLTRWPWSREPMPSRVQTLLFLKLKANSSPRPKSPLLHR